MVWTFIQGGGIMKKDHGYRVLSKPMPQPKCKIPPPKSKDDVIVSPPGRYSGDMNPAVICKGNGDSHFDATPFPSFGGDHFLH